MKVRLPLSRRLVEAAVKLTRDDPDRSVTADDIMRHLRLPRNESTVTALAEAIDRQWLVHNQGRDLHAIKVGPAWHRESSRP